MKEKLILLFILLSVTCATVAFHRKAADAYDAIDGIKVGLEGVINSTPPGTNFSFAYIGDTARAASVLVFMRYILAPRYVSANGSEYDTLLIMCHEQMYESMKHKIEDDRTIIAKANYKRFYFLATCSK